MQTSAGSTGGFCKVPSSHWQFDSPRFFSAHFTIHPFRRNSPHLLTYIVADCRHHLISSCAFPARCAFRKCFPGCLGRTQGRNGIYKSSTPPRCWSVPVSWSVRQSIQLVRFDNCNKARVRDSRPLPLECTKLTSEAANPALVLWQRLRY